MQKDIGVIQKLGMIGVIAVLFNILAIVITTFTGFSKKVDG